MTALDIENKYVIGDTHNLQVDSDNNLLLIIDAGNKDITGESIEIPMPTLVYDIDPATTNSDTGLACSISPKMIRVLEGGAKLKVLTSAEKARVQSNTETYDADGNMILDMPISDAARPTVTLSAFGSLPRSALGMAANAPFNASSQTQYCHDVHNRTVNGKSYISTCYQEMGWCANAEAILFGYTMGQYTIFDIANIRDPNDTLSVYQTPIHDGLKDSVRGGKQPMHAFAHNSNISHDVKTLYCSSELPGSGQNNADKNFQCQSMFSVYDLTDMETQDIKFKKLVTNYGWLKSVTPDNLSNFGYDANHNFSSVIYGGVEYLAISDYVDGVHVFSLEDRLNPKQVGKANPTLRLQSTNPYYATDTHGALYPWVVGQSGSKWGGVWGCSFGDKGDLFVMDKESVAVYKLGAGSTDIRDYVNMMTNQKFTKYPSLKRPDYIIGYDNDTELLTKLEIHDVDRDLDIAVLKVKSGEPALSGGNLVLNNSVNVGDAVLFLNGSGGNAISMKHSMVSNNKFLVAPTMTQKTYLLESPEIIINGESGKIALDHQLVDLDRAKNEEKVNFASKLLKSLPSLLLSSSTGSGSSGAPVLDKDGKLCGMITSSLMAGRESFTIAAKAAQVLSVADKLIAGNNNQPMMGLKLKQDMLAYSGYLIEGSLKGSNARTLLDATAASVAAASSLVAGDLAFELVKIGSMKVGPGKSANPLDLTSHSVGDSVSLELAVWNGDTKLANNQVVSLVLEAQPQNMLYEMDETSSSTGNPFPNYPFAYRELVGFFV